MEITLLSKRQLSDTLKKHFTPARPISSIEHLVGRDLHLDESQNALLSAGRHLFIFGDRGVGKSSLAQTAAVQANNSKTNPILLACTPKLTFFQLMSDLLNEALSQVTSSRATEVEISLNLGPISAKLKQCLEKGVNVEIKSVNAATTILRYVSELGGGGQIIIIDEFDRMKPRERELISDLIKQISDQSVDIKFIFCGVASSLEEFVGFHPSVGRYVFSVHLDRLDLESRKQIISTAYDAMGVFIDSNMLIRISQISDGYPYFVHLIGEQIIYCLHYNAIEIRNRDGMIIEAKISGEHFDQGIKRSVAASEGFLKEKYEKATMDGGSRDYEFALWASADSPTLTRKVGEIYDSSYLYLCDQFQHKPLNIDTFRNRMSSLRRNHGEILRSQRPGWYQFSENMMRGYVRMRAIAAGAILSPDHHLGVRRRQF